MNPVKYSAVLSMILDLEEKQNYHLSDLISSLKVLAQCIQHNSLLSEDLVLVHKQLSYPLVGGQLRREEGLVIRGSAIVTSSQ